MIRRAASIAARRGLPAAAGRRSRTVASSASAFAAASRFDGEAASPVLPPTGMRTAFDLTDPSGLMSYSQCRSYGPIAAAEAATAAASPSGAAAAASVSAPVPSARSVQTSATLYTEPAAVTSAAPSAADADAARPIRRWTPQLTKIVATIGPTSEQLPVLQELVRCGLRVMRLNFSHATVEEVELRTRNLALCQGRHGVALANGESADYTEQNTRAILLDTRGPEIRTGKLRNDRSGHETVKLEVGETIVLHTTEHWADAGSTEKDLYIDYAGLHKCLEPGMKVLLDDGAVILSVQSVEGKEFHGSVVCTIDNSAELRSRAGVNLPGAELDLPPMSEKDKVDIRYGMTKDVDYVAASFVQNAEGVREIRRYIRDCAKELGWLPSAPLPLIISKIESVAALRNFDSILEESDGIMVARGDLGVEIPIQQVTNAQKEMVAACNAVGKPVIVATQMLESMALNPRPTRAEVADVTNAVYDGADAVMLSGETAKGKYPVEAVKMMNEIIYGAERFALGRSDLVGPLGHGSRMFQGVSRDTARSQEVAIAKAAVTAAEERHASAILVLTDHGTLPRFVSGFRPNVPIIAFCPSAKIARQLMLHRGVHPIIGTPGLTPGKRCARALSHAAKMGMLDPGDDVICVLIEDDEEIGRFATMKVARVPTLEERQRRHPNQSKIAEKEPGVDTLGCSGN